MTYTEMVEKIRNVYEYADARNIFEHIAMQINISGDGAGIMYMEVADRAGVVEPYDYKDRDGEIFIEGKNVDELLNSGLTLDEARDRGLIRYVGSEKKLRALRNLVVRKKNRRKTN